MKSFVVRHRMLVSIAGLAAGVGALFVALYFEPQALFFDKKVSEASPVAKSAGQSSQTGGAESDTSDAIASGEFRGLAHPGSGTALIVAANGKRYLRFEDLKVDNGPDLKVYISRAPASGPGDAFDDDFVDLGALKGNIGDQNYELPADLDPTQFRSAVVWCKRFAVGFAVAPLDPS